MFRVALSFVFKDILRGGKVFILVIISLAVGSVAILTTSGILLGFQNMLTDGSEGWLAHIVVTSENESIPSITNAKKLQASIDVIPDVESTSLRSYADSLSVFYEDKPLRTDRIIGITVVEEKNTTLLSSRLIEGEFLNATSDFDEVVIGLQFADGVIKSPFDGERVGVGEYLTITTEDGVSKRYRIRGIIDAKTFVPNWFIIFHKNELEKLTTSQKNSEIVIKLNTVDDTEDVMRMIAKLNTNVTIRTAEEQSGFISDILETVTFITGSIKVLLIISIFMIVNIVFFISVSQKRRQIGIMKSMGATNTFIITIYLIEALFNSLLAYGLGLLIFSGMYYQSLANPTPLLIGDFNLVISQSDLLISGLVILVAAMAGSLFPSYLAVKTRIVDVIRNSV